MNVLKTKLVLLALFIFCIEHNNVIAASSVTPSSLSSSFQNHISVAVKNKSDPVKVDRSKAVPKSDLVKVDRSKMVSWEEYKKERSWATSNQDKEEFDHFNVGDNTILKVTLSGLIALAQDPHYANSLKKGNLAAYLKGKDILVQFGAVSKSVLNKLDLSNEVFYADFDWDILLETIRNNKTIYREVPKYPAVRRDLSMLLDQSILFD